PALRFDRDIYINPSYSDKLEHYATDIRDLLLAYGNHTGKGISHTYCPDPIGQRLTDIQCAQQFDLNSP
ncbi:hypothetical protein PENTCL1PPCAC_8348, partial [Pristionchus entomophagus]